MSITVSDCVWQRGRRWPGERRMLAGGLDHALVEEHDDHGCGDTCRPESDVFSTNPLAKPPFRWAGQPTRKVECGEQ